MWCGTTEAVGSNGRLGWPLSTMPLGWTIEQVPEEFSDDEYTDIVAASIAPWVAASGLEAEQRDNRPNLVFTTRQIDRQNGVLAEANVGHQSLTKHSTLKCWVDLFENWVLAKNHPRNFMDILKVLIHECGHLFGIMHITSGKAIMNPSVSEVRRLLGPDTEAIQKLYGKPTSRPAPTDDDELALAIGKCLLALMPALAKPAEELEGVEKQALLAWEHAKKVFKRGVPSE